MNGLSGKPRLELHGTGPKGIPPVSDTMRACHRLYIEGENRPALAKLYGVSIHTIHSWIARVSAVQKDERNLGRMGR